MITEQNLASLRLALINHKRIAVTGASGWLGREAANLIVSALGNSAKNHLILVSSSPKKIWVRNQEFQTVGWSDFISMGQIDMLFHFAFLTQEKAKVMGVQKYIAVNRNITSDVNKLLIKNPSCRVFVASSGAAEYYLGGAGPSDSMHLYGALKREAEDIFFGNNRILTLQNMRIWNITGQGMQLDSPYAVAQFFKQALANKVITLTGNRLSSRTYVDAREMILVFILTHEFGQRRTLNSGGFKINLAGLAIEIANRVGISTNSIFYKGEHFKASHYNPDPLPFNTLAIECGIKLSGISEQINSLHSKFSRLS